MPSKGTPVVPVRMSEQLQAEIELTINRRNLWTRLEPWSFSDFIRVACLEKMSKMARSRAPRGVSPRKGPATDGALENEDTKS